MADLTRQEQRQVSGWLRAAHKAALAFDGSEQAEARLIDPLNMFDEFVRAKAGAFDAETRRDVERDFARAALPDAPADMPRSVHGVLDIIDDYYIRLQGASQNSDTPEFWDMLKDGGAVLEDDKRTFVKTDDGKLQAGSSDAPNSYELRTEARLATLIQHLAEDGVNGQKIYLDDLHITRGQVDDNMMRKHPYYVVQIPRLNMEIAVCDQIGETTFVKQGTVTRAFWDEMSKDDLKARDDVLNVDKHDEAKWWADIQSFLEGNAKPTAKKVDVAKWSKKKPSLDGDLVKKAVFKHYQDTEEFLGQTSKDRNGKPLRLDIGGELIRCDLLDAHLSKGGRGLKPVGGFAGIKTMLAQEHGSSFPYENHLDQNDLKLKDVKVAVLKYYQDTKEFLTSRSVNEKGQQVCIDIAGEMILARTLDGYLTAQKRGRGLPDVGGLAGLNTILAKEHGDQYPYENFLDVDKLKLEDVKKALLKYFDETGKFLTANGTDEAGKPLRIIVAEEVIAATSLHNYLRGGQYGRGLPDLGGLAGLNADLVQEYGDRYPYRIKTNDYSRDDIKSAILFDWLTYGRAPSKGTKDPDKATDGSHKLLVGGKIKSVASLNNAAQVMQNGLTLDDTIAKIKKELLSEHPWLADLKPDDAEEPYEITTKPEDFDL